MVVASADRVRATYRLQLGGPLTFPRLRRFLPYFERLGVSDLYLSPILAARRGSTHRYDVVDPSRIDPSLGHAADFLAFSEEAARRDIGLLQDIVPNHMAASDENPWWADVLESGRESLFAQHFDIDWSPPRPDLRDRVLVPVLGDRYGRVLLSGQLRLVLDRSGLAVTYFDHRFPLSIGSYHAVLSFRRDVLLRGVGEGHPSMRALSRLLRRIAGYARTAAQAREPSFARAEERRHIKQALVRSVDAHPELRRHLASSLRLLNGRKGDAASFAKLDRLLGVQHYRLAYWKRATQDINYRRFFNVNDLVSVRVEDPWIFEERHRLLIRHAAEGRLHGVRVDHVDGLADPEVYLKRLARSLPRRTYLVVEKILADRERLPASWPVDGTTGYDALNLLNRLFVDTEGYRELEGIHARFTGDRRSFTQVARDAKRRVIAMHFNSEMESLGLELGGLAARDPAAEALSFEELSEALLEVTVALPVYRTYARRGIVGPRDAAILEQAIAEAASNAPSVSRLALAFLQRVLLLDPAVDPASERRARSAFVSRWQQFTGPVMAKGVEDTAFYRYGALISLNEVGGNPAEGGISLAEFHGAMLERGRSSRHSMIATTTHDTKRGEDARARLSLLSEIPQTWERALRRWSRAVAADVTDVNGRAVPGPAEQSFLFQALIGVWPPGGRPGPDLPRRMREFALKAAREAKLHTSWLEPDSEYEQALLGFVDRLLAPTTRNRFMPDFIRFCSSLAAAGAVNSLAQLLVKLTAPGVPDLYQGSELWDHRLVDPDNRRPVDFRLRAGMLASLSRLDPASSRAALRELLARWNDGRVKLYVTARTLAVRNQTAALFHDGSYVPLEVTGPRRRHVLAYARRLGRRWAITVVPRFPLSLGVRHTPLPSRLVWKGTRIVLPSSAPTRFAGPFTGERIEARVVSGVASLAVYDVLARFPVALLVDDGSRVAGASRAEAS